MLNGMISAAMSSNKEEIFVTKPVVPAEKTGVELIDKIMSSPVLDEVALGDEYSARLLIMDGSPQTPTMGNTRPTALVTYDNRGNTRAAPDAEKIPFIGGYFVYFIVAIAILKQGKPIAIKYTYNNSADSEYSKIFINYRPSEPVGIGDSTDNTKLYSSELYPSSKYESQKIEGKFLNIQRESSPLYNYTPLTYRYFQLYYKVSGTNKVTQYAKTEQIGDMLYPAPPLQISSEHIEKRSEYNAYTPLYPANYESDNPFWLTPLTSEEAIEESKNFFINISRMFYKDDGTAMLEYVF